MEHFTNIPVLSVLSILSKRAVCILSSEMQHAMFFISHLQLYNELTQIRYR